MGFKQVNYDTKKIADDLDVSIDDVRMALAKSRLGGFARIWEVYDLTNGAEIELPNGSTVSYKPAKYSIVNISTSKKKSPESSEWETDYSNKFVKFIGHAHEKVKNLDVPSKGIGIQILSCETQNGKNEKTGKHFTTDIVYAFSVLGSEKSNDDKSYRSTKPNKMKAKKETEYYDDEDELPFG